MRTQIKEEDITTFRQRTTKGRKYLSMKMREAKIRAESCQGRVDAALHQNKEFLMRK